MTINSYLVVKIQTIIHAHPQQLCFWTLLRRAPIWCIPWHFLVTSCFWVISCAPLAKQWKSDSVCHSAVVWIYCNSLDFHLSRCVFVPTFVCTSIMSIKNTNPSNTSCWHALRWLMRLSYRQNLMNSNTGRFILFFCFLQVSQHDVEYYNHEKKIYIFLFKITVYSGILILNWCNSTIINAHAFQIPKKIHPLLYFWH